jgi:nucleoside-diphosphate-sugar epimerase
MIVVTGAAGRLGKQVVRRLVDEGFEILGTDKVPFDDSPTPYIQADLCDAEKANEVLKGADALIHMGATPGPQRHGSSEIFENNVPSTFNIMMAAADKKLRRVVFSSSAFGMGWAHEPAAFIPKYLPLDEEHPMMPFEAYGLSKQVGECIAGMISRNSSTSVASLRFTNVAYPEVQAEFPWAAPTQENPRTLVMWAYADSRDVVEMHLLALRGEFEGHEAFLIAQPKTRFQEPTLDLIRQNFGSQVEIRGELRDNASVISTRKAQHMLGFKPRQNWKPARET